MTELDDNTLREVAAVIDRMGATAPEAPEPDTKAAKRKADEILAAAREAGVLDGEATEEPSDKRRRIVVGEGQA